jgi:hypothetical protein
MGPNHAVAGACVWLAAAPALHITGLPAVAGLVVTVACSHGRLSPDMDNYPMLGRLWPGGHRGLSHWWPLPLAVFLAAWTSGVWWWWAPAAAALAWAGHIAADGVFGRVPVLPRLSGGWVYAGVGFRTDGMVERWAATPALVVGCAWLLYRTVAPYLVAHPAVSAHM